MSEPENFLDRWSRRKRETAEGSAPAEPKAARAAPAAEAEPAEPAFDPKGLPPIESISTQSDVTAFLKPGVPTDLTREALRRAWSTDPAIRDFIGPVENGWDFNDPNAIPGFGTIDPVEVARLLAQAIGAPSSEPQKLQKVVPTGERAPLVEKPGDHEPAHLQQWSQGQPRSDQELPAVNEDLSHVQPVDVASQHVTDEEKNSPPLRPRGHGGALPK